MKSGEITEEIMVRLSEPMRELGFKRSRVDTFVRKGPDTLHRFGLLCRRDGSSGSEQIYVTPFVNVVFVRSKRIADAIRGRKRVQLPSVGGALGNFSPRRSLVEWPIRSPDQVKDVAQSILDAVSTYGQSFWVVYATMESTIEAEENTGGVAEKRLHWEDMVGIYYVARGREKALDCLSNLPPEQLSDDDRARALDLLVKI